MADNQFTLIAITPPEPLDDEAARIATLLRSGFDRVHLRHPAMPVSELEKIIAAIPSELRGAISLHDHFHLAPAYGIGGIHLNGRNPQAPRGWEGITSRSCHSVAEVEASRGLDYVTLSPVFDSISKPGYRGVNFDSLPTGIIIVALGGVTPEKFNLLKSLGYAGAAMLSAAWTKSQK
ncbi:MAG: thiamine phosphate synthase [Muribaculaceae bacterium]|nr:thiamine phosphate synthase [Muribaculaceae bacterium]